MRRLTLRARRLPARRDHGATIIFVALTMVALMGFTALGVDGGALWSDHKQLQNGADAGALAIAQACADGNCGDYATAANQYAISNKLDTNASGVVTNLDTGAGSVTVQDTSTRQLWFAPVIGINTETIRASATATWGPKSAGVFLPLAFSLCAFWLQSGTIIGDPIPSGTQMSLYLKSGSSMATAISADPTQCLANTNAAHNEVAGGFGWLVPDGSGGTCTVTVSDGSWVASSTGASAPCSFGTSLQNQVVQIPIFDQCTSSSNGCAGGSNAQYHIYAIASFLVTGYCFPPAYWPSTLSCNSGMGSNGARIVGVFQTFTSADSITGPGGPALGANQVTLTK